jgi:drug/metabolite transporter (DMT)-like permease
MDRAPDTQTRAYLYGLAAVLFWSTAASAFKLGLRVLTPLQLLAVAACSSTLALLAVLAVQGNLSRLRHLDRRGLGISLAAGLLNPFLYYRVLFEAYARLPGQEAQPLNYTWALALPLLSIPLLKQRLRPASLVALLVSFAGVYVIATRGRVLSLQLTDPLGVGLALGSSVIWALYWILNLRDSRDGVVKLCFGFACGSLFTLINLVAAGEAFPRTWPGWLAGAYVGCFEMGFTFVLWLTALRLSRTTARIANLIFLAPFVSLVLLHFVVGEPLFPSSVIGLLFIVTGIGLQRRFG